MDAHGADDEIRVEGLDPPVETPRLRGKVIARASVHELLDELSSDLTAHALNCVREFGDFHLALSGGQTPMPFYEQLMYDPRYRAIPWRRTHLWMVDERCVGFEDERSNFGRIKEVIVDHSDIPPEQVHPMIAMAPGAGERYERELREALGWRQKGHDRLDFVLLGVGPDGHTASIFPGSPALAAGERLAMDVPAPTTCAPHVARCTLTLRTINAARFVAPLVIGASKHAVLARAAAGAAPEELPIAAVRPAAGELRWYLDHAAAGAKMG
jgi:6-phosphogluconolactonase